MYDTKATASMVALSKSILSSSGSIPYDDLVDLLKFHEWRYYVKNEPLISDKDYDALFRQLQNQEKSLDSTAIRSDSPTQRVSSDLTSEFPTVTHLNPMLSLANSYNGDDLMDFDKQIRKLCNLGEEDVAYFVEPKYDGGSIALVYENDKLVRAATRGNGAEGEEMTANARVAPSVPLTAAFSKLGIHRVELRGEAVIAKDVFLKNNERREKEGQAIFANPRNAATGGLRMKDPTESKKRGLEIFIFQLAFAVDAEGNDKMASLGNHEQSIIKLQELGFKVSLRKDQACSNISEAIKACNQWETDREKFAYEIDGAVVKVNDFALQDLCGSTTHHPRWAIAFKFKAKQAHTKLLEVEYQVGKTGAITPVAKTEPVQLAGVTVSSISLHNEEFIQQKDLRIGDTIVIERAGDVIPYVVKSIADVRDGSEQVIAFPTSCPSCASTLGKSENEAAWRCPNSNCKAQLLQRLTYHVSKDAMNIDGFGKSYVETFHAKGWLSDLSDVYNLNYDTIAVLEGFGQRSATKLKDAINKSKSNPIHRLLASLSVHHLGRKASKLISQEINHVLELESWTEEHFTNIKDIGPVVAENVIAFFSKAENIQMLKTMELHGVNLTQTEEDKPKVVSEDAPLFGKTILFTGSLQTMSRKVAQTKAEEAGAKNISGVSSKLNILVVGEKAGSKLKKAQALGTVQIMTEEEFNEVISS